MNSLVTSSWTVLFTFTKRKFIKFGRQKVKSNSIKLRRYIFTPITRSLFTHLKFPPYSFCIIDTSWFSRTYFGTTIYMSSEVNFHIFPFLYDKRTTGPNITWIGYNKIILISLSSDYEVSVKTKNVRQR